ncbi:MAG: ABC transporter permease [Chloroflexi bacterium]|nr:MAG: ABC transporter permease [Chloroflexota bacterium]
MSLLIAAPTSALPVLLGRSVQWVVDGALISSIAFYGVGLLFRLPMRWPNVLLVAPLLVVVAATTYMFGAFLAALVLQRIGVRNLAFNITYLAMMSICGVNVPVTFLPGWLQTLANLLPLTHGLNAIRALLSGSPVAAVVGSLGMEVGVGLGWLTLAILVFGVTLEKTRMDGSLEFAD